MTIEKASSQSICCVHVADIIANINFQHPFALVYTQIIQTDANCLHKILSPNMGNGFWFYFLCFSSFFCITNSNYLSKLWAKKGKSSKGCKISDRQWPENTFVHLSHLCDDCDDVTVNLFIWYIKKGWKCDTFHNNSITI